MEVNFKFDIGDSVDHNLGFTGTVTHLLVNRSGQQGYWLEYLDATNVVREVYAPECDLAAS